MWALRQLGALAGLVVGVVVLGEFLPDLDAESPLLGTAVRVAEGLAWAAFFLQLFNANQTAPFVDWVYRAARRIMQPFRGIFPSVEGEQGSVFDVSMLFAMFMYGLLALGLQALIAWIDRKIASLRYEAMWRPATTPARGPDVVTIPAAAPAPPPAARVVASPPPSPPASSGEPPTERR